VKHTIVALAGVLILSNLRYAPAAEISLPAVGTNVNYDYFLGAPEFSVGTNVPSERLVHSQVTFAEGKHLHVDFQADVPTVQIDLEFTAPSLFNLFEPDVFSFDETIALLFDNGLYGPLLRNEGVGYYTNDPDVYSYSWSFTPIGDFSLYGLQWNISPDLKSGAALPEHVDIAIDFYANGHILVVPEPACFRSVLLPALMAILMTRGCPRIQSLLLR